MALIPAIRQEFALTDQQALFVAKVARGVGPADAAELAGFVHDHGFALLRMVRIQGAIEAEIRRILYSEAAPLALKTAVDLLSDKTPAATRAVAAKLILDKAGYSGNDGHSQNGPTETDLSAMSVDQLKDYLGKKTAEIDRLEGELASRAKPVVAPDSAPNGVMNGNEARELLD